jgi:hypothetical protein
MGGAPRSAGKAGLGAVLLALGPLGVGMTNGTLSGDFGEDRSLGEPAAPGGGGEAIPLTLL